MAKFCRRWLFSFSSKKVLLSKIRNVIVVNKDDPIFICFFFFFVMLQNIVTQSTLFFLTTKTTKINFLSFLFIYFIFKQKNGSRIGHTKSRKNLTHCLSWHYMFKVNNSNTRTRSEIYSKLTIKTPEWHEWRHLVLLCLLLTLNRLRLTMMWVCFMSFIISH